MSIKAFAAFIERLDSRLTGRSTRQLAERFGLAPIDVKRFLEGCPTVRERPKGLWSYLPHIQPVHASYEVVAAENKEIKTKPKKIVKEVSPVVPAGPSPLDAFKR